jgi:aldose 1-epimerase
LNCKVTYELTPDNAIKISYEATTDKNTVVNLTNHSYFNLNGIGSGTILNHLVQLKAANYTPVDSTLIPTGKIEPVAGTPFDFSKPTTIGSRINADNEQLKNGKGYDHNFVLDKHDLTTPIATVTGDQSGIEMEVFTEEPGLQFYSGNFMTGSNTMHGGGKDEHRTGFAMETQHFPDSPNKPQFPSTELKPGEVYKTVTIYKFLVSK